MKHRIAPALVLTVLAFTVVAATAVGGANARLFQFRGQLLNAGATSVQVQVAGGNHAALRALLGQSQNQSFTIGARTEILVWSHGTPRVASIADLKQGDNVQVSIRANAGA